MTKPLRVLHITRDYPPRGNGGLGIAVGGLCRAQARAGLECSVVSFDNYRPAAEPGAKAEPESVTGPDGIRIVRVANAAALPRAHELVVASGADIVHVHHGLLWDFASGVAEALSSPTVFTVHVLQSEQNRLRGIGSTQSSEAQQRALAECSLVHAPSEAAFDLLRAANQDMAERLRVVRLGHDEWPAAREAFAKERFTDSPRLLYVGRFADINGFGQLIEALPSILSAHPNLSVTLAGGLPDNPKSEARWKKRWDALGGEKAARVHFAGWLDRDALSELYGQATALVVPSWLETFGQVVLEGMLHGAPLITTGAGAIGELVDERAAIVVEAKSAAAIADAVESLLENPAEANDRRRYARDCVANVHHWNDRVGGFQQLYQDALDI